MPAIPPHEWLRLAEQSARRSRERRQKMGVERRQRIEGRIALALILALLVAFLLIGLFWK